MLVAFCDFGRIACDYQILKSVVTHLTINCFCLQFCIGTIKDDFLGVINGPSAA